MIRNQQLHGTENTQFTKRKKEKGNTSIQSGNTLFSERKPFSLRQRIDIPEWAGNRELLSESDNLEKDNIMEQYWNVKMIGIKT